MGLFNEDYLEEAGAHKRYINDNYKKIKDAENKASAYNNIAHDRNTSWSVGSKAKETADKYRNAALSRRMSDPNLADVERSKYAVNRHRKHYNNWEGYNKDFGDDEYAADYVRDISRRVKQKLGVGKDNMPKEREAGTYLKAQRKIKDIKEACEYILDMLDEEYYYDEYED